MAHQPSSKAQSRAKGRGFRTDTDISRHQLHTQGTGTGTPGERDLQPWMPEGAGEGLHSAGGGGGALDDETFGPASGKPSSRAGGWDQFATNAALFGSSTTYSEDLYTTRLDRSKAGYKAREREAERLAREIEGQVTNNVHQAEERGQRVPEEEEGWDEEDRYAGVVRKAGAYVPPGARSGKPSKEPADAPSDKQDSESLVVDGVVDGKDLKTNDSAITVSLAIAAVAVQPPKETPTKTPTKAAPSPAAASATPQEITHSFRRFAEDEREKVAQAKLGIKKTGKTERDQRLAELIAFGKTFKVPGTKPKDLEGVLAVDKGKADAEPNPGKSKPEEKAAVKPNGHRPPIASGVPHAKPRISMHIPEIPPFKGSRPTGAGPNLALPPKVVVPATADMPVPGIANAQSKEKRTSDAATPGGGLNPAAAAFAFKPNPAASAFKPGNAPGPMAPRIVNGAGGHVQAHVPVRPNQPPMPGPINGPIPPVHVRPQQAHQPPPHHAFFIVPPKRVPGVNIRDEFNPMRSRRAGRPEEVPLTWNYSGRKVLQTLHQPMHATGVYSLQMNGVHPNLAGGGIMHPGMMPPMQGPGGLPGLPLPPPGPPQQPQPNALSPAGSGGAALEDERFSPIPTQPGSGVGVGHPGGPGLPAFQPGGVPPAGPNGPPMGPGGFNAYRGMPHQQPMQHMGQPGIFPPYPGNGIFMGGPMMQGMPYNPQMMPNGPLRPIYYPQPGMTSHPTSPMPHAMTPQMAPQMMSPHPPP